MASTRKWVSVAVVILSSTFFLTAMETSNPSVKNALESTAYMVPAYTNVLPYISPYFVPVSSNIYQPNRNFLLMTKNFVPKPESTLIAKKNLPSGLNFNGDQANNVPVTNFAAIPNNSGYMPATSKLPLFSSKWALVSKKIALMSKTLTANNASTIKTSDIHVKKKNFNQVIENVLRSRGKTVDSIYDQNLFNIVTEYAGYNPSEVSSAYHLSPDLISYIQDHSYLEISWCFKLSSNMSFQKTFLKINEMESFNKFTIYSATGSKDWPSGKELRHVVCNTISKQPISSKFYEQFLVPARCKFLGVNITEFNSIKKFLDIEQLATRYEFAQALRIELVQKRLQPKLLEAISKKLKNISFDSILAHNQLSNTNINNNITHHTVKIMQQSSVLKLIADTYRLPQKGLASIMKFYTQKSHKVSMMNSVTFKSLVHFLNLPLRSNASFGEMFVKLSFVMTDLQHRMDAPMILIVDKNRVTKSVSNKTILNALISSAKEPRDVLVAFYEISPELEHFIEATTFYQLQQMLGQSTIRLEHLSINFIVNLLKKQTKGNLRNGTLKFSQNNINTMFYNAVKNIISHTKMIDFQRMYRKEWNAKKIYQQTLMSISKQQGLSGREFVRLYNMEGKKLSDVTRFSNYSLSKIKPRIQGNVLEYTLEQLAQQVREQLKLPELKKSPNSTSNAQTKSFNFVVKKVKSPLSGSSRSSSTERDVDASTLAKRADSVGIRRSMIIAPAILCTLGIIVGVAYVYYTAKCKHEKPITKSIFR